MSENRLRMCTVRCCACVTCELCDDGKCGCQAQHMVRCIMI